MLAAVRSEIASLRRLIIISSEIWHGFDTQITLSLEYETIRAMIYREGRIR